MVFDPLRDYGEAKQDQSVEALKLDAFQKNAAIMDAEQRHREHPMGLDERSRRCSWRWQVWVQIEDDVGCWRRACGNRAK